MMIAMLLPRKRQLRNMLNNYGCCVWTMSIVVLYQNSYINVLFWLKSTLYTHFMPWQYQCCCRSIMCCLILLCLFNILRSFRVCVHARVFVHAYESGRNYIHACNNVKEVFWRYDVSGKRTPLRRKMVTGLHTMTSRTLWHSLDGLFDILVTSISTQPAMTIPNKLLNMAKMHTTSYV